jgi:hypothetical protein
MADQVEISQTDLDKLVKEFQAIENVDEKARFYHANPALHRIFRSIHFSKPAEPTAK